MTSSAIENLSPEINLIAEAKRHGSKFIKVYLHPNAVGNSTGPIRFSGCVELKGSMSGIGPQAKYTFREIRGGSFEFQYSENEHEWICWLFDDQQKGSFSPIGYNRDLLAGHIGQRIFVIKDSLIYTDLKRRAEWLKDNIDDIRRKKQERADRISAGLEPATAAESINELKNQREFLDNRINQLENFEDSKSEEQKQLDDDYEKSRKSESDILDEQLNSPSPKTRQQKAAETRAKNKALKEKEKETANV